MNKKAFTLAELLITLAIIGIVAVLTLPTLINGFNKKIYMTQLKKSYSQIQNGFKLMMAQEGVSSLSQTELYLRGTSGNLATEDPEEKQDLILRNFNKYFRITELITGMNLDESDMEKLIYTTLGGIETQAVVMYILGGALITLNDGSTMLWVPINSINLSTGEQNYKPVIASSEQRSQIQQEGGNMYSLTTSLFIDINGSKKPNVIGRDLYVFAVDDAGTLFPIGGKDAAIFQRIANSAAESQYWADDKGCDPTDKSDPLRSGWGGMLCAGRIFEENWTMNY